MRPLLALSYAAAILGLLTWVFSRILSAVLDSGSAPLILLAGTFVAVIVVSFWLGWLDFARDTLRGGPSVALPSVPLWRQAWRTWAAFAHRASVRQTTLLLGLVYILVVGPTSIVLRILGKRPLGRAPRQAETYWKTREPRDRDSLLRQF